MATGGPDKKRGELSCFVWVVKRSFFLRIPTPTIRERVSLMNSLFSLN